MFWRVTTFTQLSPMEAIMDKEEFTLEELMNEDDIIQECKAANPRLVAYLSKREVIERLIGYLSEPPEDEVNFKYSFTACEILCCELDDVLAALIRDDELMARLFSLLQQPPPLNSTLAGYFGRVVGSLLSKRAQHAHEYLEANRGILDKLVAHVDTTSTVEVILRLVGADEMASPAGNEHAAWLGDTTFMAQLLERLCAPPAGSNKLERVQRAAQQNVGNILVAIAHAQCMPMFEQLTEPAYLRRLLEQAAHSKAPGVCDVLHPVLLVCIALLDPRAPRAPLSAAPMTFGIMPAYEPPPEPDLVEARAAARSTAAAEIVRIVPQFAKLLDAPDGGAGVAAAAEQPYGVLRPPLGRQRITVVELGKALLRTQEPAAIRAIIESDFVGRVMELFCLYPFNSILHLHVRDILGELIAAMSSRGEGEGAAPHSAATSAAGGDDDAAAEGGPAAAGGADGGEGEVGERNTAASAEAAAAAAAEMEDVATRVQDCLFDKVDLLSWLMDMSENADSACFQPRENRAHVPLRAAYHGHVLELAEQLDAAEKHACASGNHGLASAIQLSADWARFMAEVVTPRLENSRREAWQAPMPSADGDCLLQDDFATGMDMPDAYPNVDDNFGSGYEGDQAEVFGGQVRYVGGMFEHDDDDDDEDHANLEAAQQPRSHSIEQGEHDDDSDGSGGGDSLGAGAGGGSDGSDDDAAPAPLAADVVDVTSRLASVDLLSASTLEDDDAVVVRDSVEDDAGAAPPPPVATGSGRGWGHASDDISSSSGEVEAASQGGENSAENGATTPRESEFALVEDDEGEAAETEGTNWWKLPEARLSDDELPPPPSPTRAAAEGADAAPEATDAQA